MRRTFILSSLAITAAIVLVFASVTFVLFNIDAVVKETIESDGSSAYKVPVTIADAKVSLKTGEGQITGLRIANPPGFGALSAINIPFVVLEVDTERVAAKAIGVRRVVLEQPKIVLEIREGMPSRISRTILGCSRTTRRTPIALAATRSVSTSRTTKGMLIADSAPNPGGLAIRRPVI